MSVVLIFLIIFGFYRIMRKRQGLSPSVLVVLVYMFSVLMSCVYLFYDASLYHFNLFSGFYYALCLIIFFIPLYNFSGCIGEISFRPKTIKFFSWIIIIGGFLYIIVTAANINIMDVLLNWSDARGEYYKVYGEQNIATNIYERIASNIYPLFIFSFPLGFYHYTRKDKKMAVLLFISSLSILVYGLSRAARQEFILWILDLATSFLMFSKGFSRRSIKRAALAIVLLVAGVGVVLYIATLSRFGNTDPLSSVFSYASGQPYNAGYFLEHLGSQKLWGQANFCYVVGKPYITIYNDVINSSMYLNVFGSIVGSYFLDFGYFSIFFIGLIAFFFTRFIRVFKKNGSIMFLYMYVIYLNMMIYGVFYSKFVDPPTVRTFILIGLMLLVYENVTEKKYKKNGFNNRIDI